MSRGSITPVSVHIYRAQDHNYEQVVRLSENITAQLASPGANPSDTGLSWFVSLCTEIGALGTGDFALAVRCCRDFILNINDGVAPQLKAIAIYLRGLAMLGMSKAKYL